MNAKIEQRHRQRLADLMNAHPRNGETVEWAANDFLKGNATISQEVALTLIANADAAARRALTTYFLATDDLAALICPDTVTEPKETEK